MTDFGAAAGMALQRLELAAVEPLITATRKRRRLAAFGIVTPAALEPAHLCLDPDPSACVAGCRDAIAVERRYLAGFLAGPAGSLLPAQLRGVPALIDLDRYPDFASYTARVRRHSKGGVLRQVRRARERGFSSRTFFRDLYRRQHYEIEASKRFRSGLVLASLFRRRPASDFPPDVSAANIAAFMGLAVSEIVEGISLPPPPPPLCTQHWTIDWGVFEPLPPMTAATDAQSQPRERLVGCIRLQRTGNIARTVDIMGHGAYLAQHVMKLLFHDVMEWLLRRAHPSTKGLRYLQYGAIEHGHDGLLDWKRSFEFAPRRFVWPAGTGLR